MSIFDRFARMRLSEDVKKRQEQHKAELTQQFQINVEQDKQQYPEDTVDIDAFAMQMLKEIARHVEHHAIVAEASDEARITAVDASTRVYLPEDHMSAYACILPPLDGGKELDMATVRQDIRYEGVSFGLDEALLEQMVAKKQHLHIFPIARGTKSVDGLNSRIEELFERRAPVQLDIKEGESIEFNKLESLQPVRKGDIICRISRAVKGMDGIDVTGQATHGRDGKDIKIPQGTNTELFDDGRLLIASIDGVVYEEDEKFYVKQQKVVFNSVDAAFGNLHYNGDVFIQGNVIEGITIKAGGDVVVCGEVLDAHIISGGTIRVLGGVRGERSSTLKAARQIQCASIENAAAEAGTDFYGEVVVNSNITSGAGIYVVGGRGLLIGGRIQTRNVVAARKIGNLSGSVTEISVGYSEELRRKIEIKEVQQEQAKATLEKLRRNVSNMRAVSSRLSMEKRAVLEQLIEQRTLYEKRVAELAEQLKQLKFEAHEANTGRVICEEIYPMTKLRIGDKEAVIRDSETNCNIHLHVDKIMLR